MHGAQCKPAATAFQDDHSDGVELLGAFEVDSEKEIRNIRDAGLDVHAPIKGKTSGSCLSRIRKQLNPIEASHE